MPQKIFTQLQESLHIPRTALDAFVDKKGDAHPGLVNYLEKYPVVKVTIDVETREASWSDYQSLVIEELWEKGPDDDDWEPSEEQIQKAILEALPEFENHWKGYGDDELKPYIIYGSNFSNQDDYKRVLNGWLESQNEARQRAMANNSHSVRAVIEFFAEQAENALHHLNNLPTENNPYCGLLFVSPTSAAARVLAEKFFRELDMDASDLPIGLLQYMFIRAVPVQLKQPFNPEMATAEQLEKAITDYNTNIIINGLPPAKHDMNEIVKWAADEAPPEMQKGAQFYKRMADIGLDVNLIMAGHNYRDQINEYQVNHQISSVLTDTHKIFGQEVTFKYCCDQLTIVEGDAEIVQQSVEPICQFFLELVERHDLVLHLEDTEGDVEPCTIDRVIAESALGKSVFISCDAHVPLPHKPGYWGYTYESDNPDSVRLSIYYGPDHMNDDGVYFVAVNPASEFYGWVFEEPG